MSVLLQAMLLCVVVAGAFGLPAQEGAPQAKRPAPDDRLEHHLAAAREAQAHADCHAAAQEYQAAVQLLPGNGELRTNEGIALYCDHQLSSATAAFSKALQLNPGLSVPHLFLGFAANRLGHLNTAAHELSVYLKSAPKDSVAHLWLGYTLAAQNAPAAARVQFQQVLASAPATTTPQMLDAAYALGEADLVLARGTALRIQQLDPSGVHLLQLAAARYRLAGDVEHAQAASDQAARLLQIKGLAAPARAQQIEQLEDLAEDQQKEALAAFASILQRAPDSFRAHQVMGDALAAAGRQSEAIHEYEAVLQLNPDLPGVHETLSRCLMMVGRFADALNALNTELTISPSLSPRLDTRIGQAELALGDTAGASASLERAIANSPVTTTSTADAPTPPEVYLLLGQVRLRQDRPAEAIPLLRRFLAADPDNSTAFYYLSRAYRALGDRPAMEQALSNFQRVSEDARQRTLLEPVTHGTVASSFSSTISAPDLATDIAAPAPGTSN